MKTLLQALLLATTLAFWPAAAQVTTNPGITGVAAPQSAVAITGGTINNTPIGATTPSTGAFTTETVIGPASTTNMLQVGTGSTTQQGWQSGNYGSGVSGLWTTAVIAAGANYSVIADNSNTYVGSPSITGHVQLRINNAGVLDVGSTGVAVTGTITASAIASSGAAQTGYLCYNTTGGVITYDGGATCLVSREELKTNLGPIDGALKTVMALKPFWGAYREGTPMQDHAVQPFLGARYTASVDGRLTSYDKAGEPLGVRYENMTAVLAAAIQQQQTQITRLQRQIHQLAKQKQEARAGR